MGSTLTVLYDYVKDFEYLIGKVGELAKKSIFKEKLSELHKIDAFSLESLSIREYEKMVSLSRILMDYGFSQTLESFKNACAFLTADYDRTKEAVGMATEKLKESAHRLYLDDVEANFLWKAHEVSDPWTVLVDLLSGDSGEAVARRSFYLKRITELANLNKLAIVRTPSEKDEIALNLSPLQLEKDFISNDGALLEILSLHTNETDLY